MMLVVSHCQLPRMDLHMLVWRPLNVLVDGIEGRVIYIIFVRTSGGGVRLRRHLAVIRRDHRR